MENPQTLEIAIDGMVEGIQILDRDLRYIYVNLAAAQHGKKAREELTGRLITECYPGFERTPIFGRMMEVMRDSLPLQIENEFTYEDGRARWFELFIEPHPNGILIRSLDITERKQLQDRLRQAQKMEAIGKLATGIAHDFTNKLGTIQGFCDLAVQGVEKSDPDTSFYLTKLQDAVAQAVDMIRQLLAVGKKQILEPQILHPNEVLCTLEPELRALVGRGVDLEMRLSADVGRIYVDPSQLERALLNLCRNAADAMDGSGRLLIETSEVLPGLDGPSSEQNYVSIVIKDTGMGIEHEILEKIFDPFFSTKSSSRGSGMGLSIVKGFIEQSNGILSVQSDPGAGATFRLWFPKAEASPVRSIRSLFEENSIIGSSGPISETVLLVAEDALLRKAFEFALRKAGYSVQVVENPSNAESVICSMEQKPALLLSDINLRETSGVELAARLAEQIPGLKILYMSGNASDFDLRKNEALLIKPIPVSKLVSSVRKVLDGQILGGLIR